MHAVQTLIDLDHGDRAQRAAEHLPEQLPVADLLRAADGAQRLARALAARRQHTPSDAADATGYDPHDVRSLYS